MAGAYSSAFTAGSLSHPDLRNYQPFAGSADADILPGHLTIASRARDLARNHPIAAGALQSHLDNVLGTGLWLAAMPDYQALGKSRAWAVELRNTVKPLWRGFADTFLCDAARASTLDGLGSQVLAGAWMNGDGLALPLWLPQPGSPWSTRIQTVESDRLCNPLGTLDGQVMPSGFQLRGGIEIDQYGGAQAYWVKRTHPGDRYQFGQVGSVNDWQRIPAETWWGRRRVIHMPTSRQRAGQTRGVSDLAAIMRTMKVAGDYTNAELKAAAVNAMLAVITESALSPEALVELLSNNPDALSAYTQGLAQRGRSQMSLEAGQIIPLMLGEKVSSFNPARPNTAFDPFMTSMLRQMASGLGVPYEVLAKDFSKTNYSSARAALLEGYRFFNGRRQHLALYFYQPVYELFFEELVDAGKIEAPDFYEMKWAYCRARWVGPGRGWVDPMKEAQAAGERMRLNISNLEDECAEQGKDWQEVLEQAAAEREYAESLGITIGEAFGVRAGAGASPAEPPATGSDGEPKDPEDDAAEDAQERRDMRAAVTALAAGVQIVQRETSRPTQLSVQVPETITHQLANPGQIDALTENSARQAHAVAALAGAVESVAKAQAAASRAVAESLENVADSVRADVAALAAETAANTARVAEVAARLDQGLAEVAATVAAPRVVAFDAAGNPAGSKIQR